jgi:tRNA/tmRNA/rRNA uracil-C5-methylase (TrmA/RlmC/RlmD family)
MPDDARAALGTLLAAAGLPPPVVVEGASFGYRHRARLAVRGRAASPKIGIFQEGSHRVVDIPRCLVHHPLVNEVAASPRRPHGGWASSRMPTARIAGCCATSRSWSNAAPAARR